MIFPALWLTYLQIIVLTTRINRRARDINLIIALFVALPIAFLYFYISNVRNINLIFSDEKLPVASSRSTYLAAIYYFFALVTLVNWLVLNVLFCVLVCFLM